MPSGKQSGKYGYLFSYQDMTRCHYKKGLFLVILEKAFYYFNLNYEIIKN